MITVIMPSMFIPEGIVDMVKKVCEHPLVGEFILMDNTVNGGNIKEEIFSRNFDPKITKEIRLYTKDGDDIYYYGTAFMKGKASITGSINALNIKVAGESEKGTSIKIPVNDSEDIGDNSFIKFMTVEEYQKIKQGKVVENNKYQGIELEFDFDIDQDANIEIILDRSSGHAMKGSGVGSMQMNINTLGKFEMTGDFIVQEGEYNFMYGGLIDKKFKNYKAFYQFASKDSIIEKYKSINLIFTQQVVCSK